MRIAFTTFEKIDQYGGYSLGIYNTMLAANAAGLDTELVYIKNPSDIKALDCDVLHCSNFIAYSNYRLSDAIKNNASIKKVFLHLHGYCIENHPEYDKVSAANTLTDEMKETLSTNNLIYSSYRLGDFFGYYGDVLHNCFDSSIFYPSNQRGSGILSVVNLTYSKGIDRLSVFNDIDVIGKKINDISMIKVNIPKNLKLLGECSRDRVADELRAHEIFVHPSRLESCSLAILEALACGVPVIASNVGDNKYMIGLGGVIVDNWEKQTIERAVDLIRSDYKKFKDNAFEQSQLFTEQKVGERLLQIYLHG